MTNGKIAVAVTGGYLLGRTKKAKLAIGLGLMLAGKKITLDPQHLARAIAGAPLLNGLNAQVRKELVDATKAAATKALTTRANGLADSLQERTASLRGTDDERDDDERAEAEDERAEGGHEGAEDEGERRPSKPRRTASASAKAPADRARKTASTAGKTATKTATRTAAKKTAAKKTARTGGGGRG
jgi:septal ring-binding cell division protein DamX